MKIEELKSKIKRLEMAESAIREVRQELERTLRKITLARGTGNVSTG